MRGTPLNIDLTNLPCPLFFFFIYYFQPVFYLLGISRGIYDLFRLLIYIPYVLFLLHLLSDLVLLYLLFLELVLKLLEYGFKEACDSNGVDMVLKKQRRWDRFEYRWAVGRQ
jgi:hypothetical protein